MNMQSYASKNLDDFLQRITPFRHLWKSVLVRATWAHLDGKDRILGLSITLEDKTAKHLPPPPHRPDVGPLHTCWEAIGIQRLEQLLKNLAAGFVKIEGRRLWLETHSGSQWAQWSSLHPGFDRPGEYFHSDAQIPVIRIHGFDSGNSTAYESVKDSSLGLQLKALDAPYENMQDVLEGFLGMPRSQRDQNLLIVSIRADVPIILGSDAAIHDGRLQATVLIPAAADPKLVSLGLIESSQDRVLRRSTLPIESTAWKKEPGRWTLAQEHSLLEKTTKAILILNYAGVFLGQKSLLALQTQTGNTSMQIHAHLDPDNEELLKCLSGQGKKRAEHFEQAVSWLFGFCGFNTQLYAHFPPVEEDAVDLIAYSREARTILGIECTISHPQTLGKMPKLATRCRRIEDAVTDSGIKVIPVLATALEEVSQSERETAAQDEIALITQKELIELLQMAGAGKQSQEVVEHIKTQLRKTNPALSDSLSGWN